jgi:hypothetical protein
VSKKSAAPDEPVPLTSISPTTSAFCVSEPDAGSDVSSLRTRAV